MFYTKFLDLRPFVAVSGMSGSGKSTLIDALLETPQFERPVSFTTRLPRDGESKNEYIFVSVPDLNAALGSRFAYADEVHNNFYAIDSKSIDQLFSRGIVPVKEIAEENISKIQRYNLCTPIVVHLRGSFGVRENRVENDFLSSMPFVKVSFDPKLSNESELPNYIQKWVVLVSQFYKLFGNDVLAQLAGDEEKNRSGYNKAAPYFSEEKRVTTRAFHEISDGFWRDVIPILNGVVLEIGPGHGWLRENFNWKVRSYQGVEISSEMLKYNTESKRITVCPIQELPMSDGSYDNIVGSLIDPCLSPSNLIHIYRLLKKNGEFIGTVPADEWSSILREIRGFSRNETVFFTPEGEAKVTSYCFSKNQIHGMLSATGFNNVEVQTLTARDIPVDRLPDDIDVVVKKQGIVTPILYGWRCSK